MRGLRSRTEKPAQSHTILGDKEMLERLAKPQHLGPGRAYLFTVMKSRHWQGSAWPLQCNPLRPAQGPSRTAFARSLR